MRTLHQSAVPKAQDWVAFIALAGTVAFLIWKAPYGFGFWDEYWYLTFGHRFMFGDAMLAEEWNVIQLFSFFLYWPVKLFFNMTGSADGIILTFRYLFVAFNAAVSVSLYLLLRKFGKVSIFAVLITGLFVPATVMAVSYYSLIAYLSALIGVLLSVAKLNKAGRILTGILFACLVLCNPFIALVYAVYSAAVLLSALHRKRSGREPVPRGSNASLQSWFWTTLGIAAVALVFFVFLLSRASVSEITANLPHLFEDSDYNISNAYGAGQNIFDLRQSLKDFYYINPAVWAAYTVLIAVTFLDKNRLRRRKAYLAAAAAVTLLFIGFLAGSDDFYNYLLCMLPVSVLGLFAYWLSERKDKRVFGFLWCWGIIVAVFEDVASNQGIKLMSLGLFSSVLASLLFIKTVADEIRQPAPLKKKKDREGKHGGLQKKLALYGFAAVLLCQTGAQAYENIDFDVITAEHFYRDISHMPAIDEALDCRLQSGPAQGLLTVRSSAKIYEDMLEDLSFIGENGKGPLLILGRYPWGYLHAGLPYACYTTAYLQYKLPETMARLTKYYALHPDKYPAYIYVPENAYLFITNDMVYRVKNNLTLEEQALDYVEKYFDSVASKGKAGHIIRVLR